jgi:hypothetical protein
LFSESDLNLEDPIEVFIVNSARRELRVKIKPKPLLDRLQSAEQKYGTTELRWYWLNFIQYFREHRDIDNPLAYFLSNPERWIESPATILSMPPSASATPPQGDKHPQGAGPVPANDPSASNCETPSNGKSEYLSVHFVGHLPELAVEWNTDVPAGPPVKSWSMNSATHKNLIDRINEPGFLEAYPDLKAKAQELHSAPSNKAKYVTFGWLVKNSDNWTTLANGGCNWTAEEVNFDRQKQKSKSKSEEALAILRGENGTN